MDFVWFHGPVDLVEDEFLTWSHKLEPYPFPLFPRDEVESGRPAFLQLATLGAMGAGDEEYVSFAARYGLMGIFAIPLMEPGPLAAEHQIHHFAERVERTFQCLLEDGALANWTDESKRTARKADRLPWSAPPEQQRDRFARQGKLTIEVNQKLKVGTNITGLIPVEPLAMWEFEAQKFAVLVSLVSAIEDPGDAYRTIRRALHILSPEHAREADACAQARNWQGVGLCIKRAIAQLINHELSGSAEWTEVKPGEFGFSARPRSLLGALHVQFAFRFQGPHWVQMCAAPDCRSPFVPQHGLQKYCSESCRERSKKQRNRDRKAPRHTLDGRLTRRHADRLGLPRRGCPTG